MMIVMNIILYWRSPESEEIWTFAACHIFWSLRGLHSETVAEIPPNLLTVAVYDRPKPHLQWEWADFRPADDDDDLQPGACSKNFTFR